VKLLLDTCVWGGATTELRSAGHDVAWSGEWPRDPGDEEILARAVAEDRILITLDKDFGELAVLHGKQHRGIVRLVGISARQQGRAIQTIVAAHEAELRAGAIITAETNRLRIRPANP
jgi:predicted nuclease of predicted toxin-antitoxin system